MNVIREQSAFSKPIKVYVWVSCPVMLLLWRFRPVGDSDLITFLEEEARRSQRPLADVSHEVGRAVIHALLLRSWRFYQYFTALKDQVVQVPGLPPVYDHEFVPQEVRIPLAQIPRASTRALFYSKSF